MITFTNDIIAVEAALAKSARKNSKDEKSAPDMFSLPEERETISITPEKATAMLYISRRRTVSFNMRNANIRVRNGWRF
jgi:capsular polysaccharide biosynthesis protein